MVTATIASSSSARPSFTLPARIRTRPRPWRVRATRSGSPKRSPMAATRSSTSRAFSKSPSPTACMASGKSTKPCSAQSDRMSPSKPPHPPDPAAGLGALAPLFQLQNQPEGGPRGSLRLPAADEALVGAGQYAAVSDAAAEHAAGDPEPLQVLGLERGVVVGGAEPVVCLTPGAAAVGVPPPLQRALPRAVGERRVHRRARRGKAVLQARGEGRRRGGAVAPLGGEVPGDQCLERFRHLVPTARTCGTGPKRAPGDDRVGRPPV